MKQHHMTGVGLSNVYLRNGFTVEDSDGDETLGDSDSESEEEDVSADEGPSESDEDECDQPAPKKHCSITDRWRMDTD